MRFYKYDGDIYWQNAAGQMCRICYSHPPFDKSNGEYILPDDTELSDFSDIENIILSEIISTFRNVYVQAFDGGEITIDIYKPNNTGLLAYIIISDDGVYVNNDFYYYDVFDISEIINGLKSSI